MGNQSNGRIRIAVLWSRLSGYLNACLRELVTQEPTELLVSYKQASQDAPYDASQFDWMKKAIPWTSEPDESKLARTVEEFRPDILIVSGWHLRAYRKIARNLKGRCLRIMAMDNCWNGTARQYFGSICSSQLVRPIADRVWLPGERQALFARRMGFSEEFIMRGLYACDQAPLSAMHLTRIDSNRPVPNAFIYVGRLVPQKGIDTLAEAYKTYYKQATQPWPLYCYGDGPQKHLLESLSGVHMKGFCQPQDMPSVLANAGCLILPSRFEPWAVAVHEATAAGLLTLVSDAVGSAPHLVQPGYNGYIFDCRRPKELTALMLKVTTMSQTQLDRMSRASHSLSLQYSPELWRAALMGAYRSWVGLGHRTHEGIEQVIG